MKPKSLEWAYIKRILYTVAVREGMIKWLESSFVESKAGATTGDIEEGQYAPSVSVQGEY